MINNDRVITNSIGMAFVTLPAGHFVMGGDPVSEQADENETPKHKVTFEHPFAIGKFAVTQAQWQQIMGSNPSRFIGEDHPVETVSFKDACDFIARLNQREDTCAYALPTEAQWEYAARAGSQSTYCFGPERSRLSGFAWYKKNSDNATHPVGMLSSNDWGLFDMHGNVHEWCADWFDRNYYAKAPARAPAGPDSGLAKVLRGGAIGVRKTGTAGVPYAASVHRIVEARELGFGSSGSSKDNKKTRRPHRQGPDNRPKP